MMNDFFFFLDFRNNVMVEFLNLFKSLGILDRGWGQVWGLGVWVAWGLEKFLAVAAEAYYYLAFLQLSDAFCLDCEL